MSPGDVSDDDEAESQSTKEMSCGDSWGSSTPLRQAGPLVLTSLPLQGLQHIKCFPDPDRHLTHVPCKSPRERDPHSSSDKAPEAGGHQRESCTHPTAVIWALWVGQRSLCFALILAATLEELLNKQQISVYTLTLFLFSCSSF